MDLKEKAAYLNGLLEGSNLDFKDEKNKIIKSALNLIQEIAEKVTELDIVSNENSELIDEIDHDLAEIEKNFYENIENGKNSNFNGCGCNKKEIEKKDFLKDINESDFKNEEYFNKQAKYEISCPNCRRVLELEDGIFEDEEIFCPECGEKINFNFKDEEDEENEI